MSLPLISASTMQPLLPAAVALPEVIRGPSGSTSEHLRVWRRRGSTSAKVETWRCLQVNNHLENEKCSHTTHRLLTSAYPINNIKNTCEMKAYGYTCLFTTQLRDISNLPFRHNHHLVKNFFRSHVHYCQEQN